MNTTPPTLEQANEIIKESLRRNDVLLGGMLKIQALLGKDKRYDVSKAEVSDIITETLQIITS